MYTKHIQGSDDVRVGEDDTNAHKLMEAFHRFRRAEWKKNTQEGCTFNEMKVLFIIRKFYTTHKKGITISEISTKMEVTSPTITQLIKGLETKGFVIRLNDQVDRRVVRVELTEAGEEVTNKAVHQFSATIQGLCDFLGEEKTGQFIELLNSSYHYLDGEYKKKQH